MHAEIEAITGESVTFTGLGAKSRAVSRKALRGVFQPAGERLVASEDFEETALLFAEGRLDERRHLSGRRSLLLRPGDAEPTARPGRLIAAGRVELSFFDTNLRHATDWFIEAEFRAPDGGSRVAFCPGWSAAVYRTLPAGRGAATVPPLARSEGWHRLTLLFDADRVLVVLDDRVVDTYAAAGSFVALRLRSGKAAAGERPEAWIDDVQFHEQVDDRPAELNLQKSDLIRLAEGDELFGEIVAADPHRAKLSGRFGLRSFRWTEIRGIEFAAGGGPPGDPVTGLIATVELAPVLGAGEADGDSLVVALQSISESELTAVHPSLGELRIPLRWIERIVPRFAGTLQLVDAARHHLGDEIREDFRAKLAEGPRLEWTVSLDAAPKGKTYLSLQVADLEPGFGATTKDGGPRAELAAGFLRTELFVNGRRIDDLNRHVSARAIPANPQRLRIALPPGLLKTGPNTVRLEQHSARNDPQQFDDCEVSRVAIEIEP